MSGLVWWAFALAAVLNEPPSGAIDPFVAATDVLHYSFEESEDLDLDLQPDHWVRRRGPDFPLYVQASIDPEHSRDGDYSLRVQLNGGRLTFYSPFNAHARVDPAFSYVFRGQVRTEGLKNDAAVLSISFLNYRKERLQRFVTPAVSGTHLDWVLLRLGPLMPHPDARFVLIGCHIVAGRNPDLNGKVWFDDLWVGRVPRLSLVRDVQSCYVTPDAPVEIHAEVSGLEPGSAYELRLCAKDFNDQLIDERHQPLHIPSDQSRSTTQPIRFPFHWELDLKERGHYQIQAQLRRAGQLISVSDANLVVLDPPVPRPHGEFGWSLPQGYGQLRPDDLAFLGAQAGVHWVKLPLWKAAQGEGDLRSDELRELFDKLSTKSIRVVGLWNDPPTAVRNQFSDGSIRPGQIFGQPPAFWAPSVVAALTRYASNVDHWQFGDDDDFGFLNPADVLVTARKVFAEAGRSPTIGVPWNWPAESVLPQQPSHTFLSLNHPDGITEEQITRLPPAAAGSHTMRWLVLKPAPRQLPAQQRAVQLVRSMIAARVRGAEAVFAADVFAQDGGLLRPDGSPGSLFLPWRTTALALQGAQFVGPLSLANRSVAQVFERNHEFTVVLMASSPTKERVNLGDRVECQDIWGRRTQPQQLDGEHILEAGPAPVFYQGCSPALVKWNLAAAFENVRVPSARGTHPNAIVGRNAYSHPVKVEAQLQLPRGWKVMPESWSAHLPAGEPFRLPLTIELPDDVSMGTADATITFRVSGERLETLRLDRSLQVGLGDVVIDLVDRRLPDGRLELEQIVTNQTQPLEILDFRCSLSIAGQKRQSQFVKGLGQGQDRKFFYAPDADALKGESVWLNLEQIGGSRNLNKRLVIGRSWTQ